MAATTKERYYLIETEAQYAKYLDILKELLWDKKSETIENKRNIDLLTLIINEWEEKTYKLSGEELTPVQLLDYLIKENKIKQKDLADKLDISSTLLSDILHYRRKMNLDVIRGIATFFKISLEAFSKPYELKEPTEEPKVSLMVNEPEKIYTTSIRVNGRTYRRQSAVIKGSEVLAKGAVIVKGSGIKVTGSSAKTRTEKKGDEKQGHHNKRVSILKKNK
jgi:HTH-type transcriptional regulator / antitoxin HigA